MLLALNTEEGQELEDRAAMLQQNGIRAAYYSQAAVTELEPALMLPRAGGALLVESDSQLVRKFVDLKSALACLALFAPCCPHVCTHAPLPLAQLPSCTLLTFGQAANLAS